MLDIKQGGKRKEANLRDQNNRSIRLDDEDIFPEHPLIKEI